MEILEYSFFQNALIGCLLASVLCGIVGTYIVTRRLVFISGGITHASFGGIGLGVCLGFNPVLSAMVFAVASACGVQWMSTRGRIREDSAIALFWTLGMSVGIICCFLTPGFMPDLPSYLFGSVLTIGTPDLVLLSLMMALVVLLFASLWRTLVAVSFDAVFARSRRLPVDFLEYMMMVVIAVTIVSTLRLVGVVLAISLLTVPQMTANLFTHDYRRMVFLSIVFGAVYSVLGIAIAYWINVPSGATIIFVSIVCYGLCRLLLLCRRGVAFSLLVLSVVMLSGCSSKKNTATTRWWQSFNTRYNVYFNGSQAFIEGAQEKESSATDDYTALLPLYQVGNKNNRDLGKAKFDVAILKAEKAIKLHSIKQRPVWNKSRRKTAKDIEWLGRREYNPFIWKAWLLLGKSQFQKGNFDEAAATFSYMSRLYATQPAICGIANSWLVRSYAEQDWLYEADDVITRQRRDSIHYRAAADWDYALTDYYLHAADYAKAAESLARVIRHERRRRLKARQWFLMGQLQTQLGNPSAAYDAYRHVVRLNPPYQLAFNARIAQTEVMAASNSKKMISRLRRMAASDNNKEYLDQVYYAIGNIHLLRKDTLNAIAAYEKGIAKATRSGIEKGVLLLTLGNLYWQRESYSDARRCYGEAIGLLDRDRPDYEELSHRSQVLDELVPHTDAIHLQDSLQSLVAMSEGERNAAIDRVIDALKKKEKEERRRQQELEAEQQADRQAAMSGTGQRTPKQSSSTTSAGKGGSGVWYFYNPMAVSQGKALFQQQWGRRENIDDWQRVNRTVLKMDSDETADSDDFSSSDSLSIALSDSLSSSPVPSASASGQQSPDSLSPYTRDYYLAQLPFTPEQKESSDAIIMEALYNSGVIFQDKLDNLPLAEKQFSRLLNQYPQWQRGDETLYHLFLLYSRQNAHTKASDCVSQMEQLYPESQWTQLLTDPHFVENARFGAHIEDSLYAATYEAFKADRHDEVLANASLSESRFPQGVNRAKVIFIKGMTLLNSGDASGCSAEMQQVVEKYPDSEVSPIAGMILKGVQDGRSLYGGKFDIGDLWTRRTSISAAADSVVSDTLSLERQSPYVFILAFNPAEVSSNKLLFAIGKYNFMSFMVRSFDMRIEESEGSARLVVSGFLNYDEAVQYSRRLSADKDMSKRLEGCRRIVVSEANMPLLGTRYSYDDYDLFFTRTLAPVKVSTEQLLNLPETIVVAESPDDAESSEEPEYQEDSESPDDSDAFDFDEDFYR